MPPVPAQHAADVLDRWVQRRVERVLRPQYRRLARLARHALTREGTVPSVDRMWRETLPALQETTLQLLRDSLEQAGRLADRAFRNTLLQEYGPAKTQQLFPTAPAERSPAVRTVLAEQLTMRDQWGLNLYERLWRDDERSRRALHLVLTRILAQFEDLRNRMVLLDTMHPEDPLLPQTITQLLRDTRTFLALTPRQQTVALALLRRLRHQLATEVQEGMSAAAPERLGTRARVQPILKQLRTTLTQSRPVVVDTAIEEEVATRAATRVDVLLRSEAARGLQRATWELAKRTPVVQTLKWTLSASHSHRDECDVKATANIGLGPGVYYKVRVPWPDHPRGVCYLTPRLVTLEQVDHPEPMEPKDLDGYTAYIEQLSKEISRQANRLGYREGKDGNTTPLDQLISRQPTFPRS